MLMTRGDAVALQRHAASTVASVVPQRGGPEDRRGPDQAAQRHQRELQAHAQRAVQRHATRWRPAALNGGRQVGRGGGGLRARSPRVAASLTTRGANRALLREQLDQLHARERREFVTMDFHFSMREGLAKSLQLLHLVLTRPRWEGSAFELPAVRFALARLDAQFERAASSALIQTLLGRTALHRPGAGARRAVPGTRARHRAGAAGHRDARGEHRG